jgi:hypothetical protein
VIVLVLILVVAAVGGVAAYVIMQYTGMDSSVPSGGTTAARTWTYDRRGGALADRIADTPSGCLITVLVALAVWIVAWLVFLIVGFRVLTS